MRRFYVPKSVWKGNKVRLSADQCRHISRVLRMKPGDLIKVFDGEREHEARLTELGKSGGWCEIWGHELVSCPQISDINSFHVPGFQLILAPAIIKAKRMDMVIEKATELGVDRIAPFTSERSVPKPRPEKAVHWRKIAESAAA